MWNPFRKLGEIFNPQSAVEEGFAYKHERPVLSEKRKKELMEASSLETPRSSWRAALGIMAPYWTKASAKERLIGAGLLATSLFMTWYAVQITVDFGHWQSGLTNTVQQLFQSMMSSRPEIFADVVQNYPALNDVLSNDQVLNSIMNQYPDTTSITYNPQFRELLGQNPEFAEILTQNPTMETVFSSYPGMAEQIAANPDLIEQLRSFDGDVSAQLRDLGSSKEHMDTIWQLSGRDFFQGWGQALSTTFNSVSNAFTSPNVLEALKNPFDEASREALSNAWNSKDLATIALKFTGMAIVSYKAAQYAALRWRAWTTGYFTNKWTDSKAYSRLKNHFNNIDNPGQRIQEDPAKFTAGAVSLLTGGANSMIQLASFWGMLYGMGTFFGVPGGMAWLSVAYAGALTGLTVWSGHKLPKIQMDQQRREADFRASLDSIHNNAELIAQNSTEEVESDLVRKRFKPVMSNSVREIGTQVKLILVDATAGNLSIPIPWVAGAFAVASGSASMGTIQTINYAFNRVTGALSFFVNRFEQLSAMKATADRIHMFDNAIEASHYIEEEKLIESLKVAQETKGLKPAAAADDGDDKPKPPAPKPS